MKRIHYIYIWVFAILVIFCNACNTSKSDKPVIYVSIAPLKSLVQDITCGDFDVEVLVPSGASPESFEPTPKQFMELNDAEFVFSTGLIDFEQSIIGKLSDKGKVIDLSNGIELIEGSCSHHHRHHDAGHHEHGTDPHIWASPKSLKVMARNIFETIHTAYPDSVKYEEAYLRLNNRIDELDKKIAVYCSAAQERYFIIYHPALTYLARDYGLEQISVEHEGKEPSGKHLSGIIDRARMDGIHRIFYQAPFSKRVVQSLADDIDGVAVEIDPLREDVIANIEEITRLITQQ